MDKQKTSRIELRSKLGFSDNDHVVGTVGRLDFQKNPQIFIEIANSYSKIDGDAKFLWIGKGVYREDMEKRINELALSDKFILPGYVDDVEPYFSVFDTFIITSRYEGLPLTVLKSIACGVPVVSYLINGINDLSNHNTSSIRENLIRSGLWTSFRTRPFSKIPKIDSDPKSIFINCMDTNPLAMDPEIIINNNADSFMLGLKAIKLLSECPMHLCVKDKTNLDFELEENIYRHGFDGPHPSGLPGTHMHFISPASLNNINWSIGYSDVISIGLNRFS